MDSAPHLFPPGDLVQTPLGRLHCRKLGSSGPLIVFETGLTMMSACWGWLAPELSSHSRPFLYDRAGLGWSDEKEGLRDAPTAAAELRSLLDSAAPSEPIILLGHSLGALINRAFYTLQPERVAAVIWLDPSHPGQMARRTIRRKMRNFFFYLEAAHLLASKNLPRISLPLLQQMSGLPPDDFAAAKYFFGHPRHLKTTARESRAWQSSSDAAAPVRFGNTPLLIISAQKNAMRGWMELQKDLCTVSNRSTHVVMTDMSHLSLLTQRPHALRVASEIRNFLVKQKW